MMKKVFNFVWVKILQTFLQLTVIIDYSSNFIFKCLLKKVNRRILLSFVKFLQLPERLFLN